VTVGHVDLSYGVERVPPRIVLKNGDFIDSFARAIIRDVDPISLREIGKIAPPYIAYLRTADFPVLSSSYVLSKSEAALREALHHKIVLVGGAWHSLAYDRGPLIDTYRTPVGPIPVAFIHANYVESVLAARMYQPLPKSILIFAEFLLLLIMVATFVLGIRPQHKLLFVCLLLVGLVIFSFSSWQTLKILFYFLVPAILLGFHLLLERILEWRSLALAKRGA
jgi:CHASE2 domain-containing sensor protein